MINFIILSVCLGLVNAQATFEVTITTVQGYSVPVAAYTNSQYDLVCTATSPLASITWITHPAGTVEPQTTSGSSSSRILTLSHQVLPSYAGLYVCNATVNGVTRTTSYAFNITLTAPADAFSDGKISLMPAPESPPYYAGSSIALQCFYGYAQREDVQFIWTGVKGLFSRWSAVSSSDVFGVYSTLTASTLSLTDDDGSVASCTIWVTPRNSSPYITAGNTTVNFPFSVTNLTLQVAVSPVSLRSMSKDSSFIYCLATKPPSVLLPFLFIWSWRDSYTGSVLTFNNSGVTTIGGTIFVVTQPPWVTNSTPTVTSTMTVIQPNPGGYSCQCDVRVSVPIDGPVSQTARSSLSITELSTPYQPANIMGKYISMDTATIQWSVPFVVYTQETYVVHYGSAPGNLNQSSILVNGSAYLNVTGEQFGVNLTGLVPYSQYYYIIVASNTEGNTTTSVMNLSFFPPSSTSISSVIPSVSNPPPAQPNTSYVGLAALTVILPIVAVVIILILVYVKVIRKKSAQTYSVIDTTSPQQPQADNLELGKSTDSTPNVAYQELQKESSNLGSISTSNGAEEQSGEMPEVQCQTRPTTRPVLLTDLEKTIRQLGRQDGWTDVWNGLQVKPGNSTVPTEGDIKRAKLSFGNATFIDGYDGSPNAYIAAQAPLQNTVEDFWRMVWEFKCRVIVMLCRLDEGKVVQFWPSKQLEDMKCGDIVVSLKSGPNFSNGATVWELQVMNQPKVVTVTLYHYNGSLEKDDPSNGWTEKERPSNEDQFSTFCNQVHVGDQAMAKEKDQAMDQAAPIVVMCNDGVGRTGAFITILAMLEMAKWEGMVDIDQFIKSSRTRCPEFVRCQEHLILCYDTVLFCHTNLNTQQHN